MKSNGTRIFLLRAILFVLLSLYFLVVFAQPDYVFRNANLQSGTNLQAGAVYKFSNVKSGVDAIVTIKSVTGGITLNKIDDNSTGFDEAFQPCINTASNANGYVEFHIDFVNAGTSTLQNQEIVAATCINVDGLQYTDGVLYEMNQIQELTGGYSDFNMTGSSLQVLNIPGWVEIKNISAVNYPGIDTVVKDIMATVINQNISGFNIRIGAINTSPTKSELRYGNVYFKRFSYPKFRVLPNRTLLSFSGAAKQNAVELKGTLSASHSYDKIIIERRNASSYFVQTGELSITNGGTGLFPFIFFDNNPNSGNNYYRIRLISTALHIMEISNVLLIKMNNDYKDLLLYNTVVQGSNPVLTIKTDKNTEATLQLIDFSGRTLYKNKVQLNAGTNNIYLNSFRPAHGPGVAIIETNEERKTVKILIQ